MLVQPLNLSLETFLDGADNYFDSLVTSQIGDSQIYGW